MTAQEIAQHLDDNGFRYSSAMDIVDEIVELISENMLDSADDWAGWERAERIAVHYLQGLYRAR